MYNYYQQQPASSLPRTGTYYQPPLLKGHQVSSLEEVRAASIDFDGSVFYFPDLANKRIFSKTISPTDGTAIINMYELKPLPVDAPITGDFITRQEFEQAIQELTKTLQAPPAQPQPAPSKNYKEAF